LSIRIRWVIAGGLAATAILLVLSGLFAEAGRAAAYRGLVVSKKGVSWDPLVHPAMAVSSGDIGTLRNTAKIVGADSYWGAGFDGTGVGVALIDTGVSPVGPLASSVVDGPDLSFDSQAPNLRYLDANGHGTFTAGIVNGIAPGARILSVKVGASDGAVDVSQVIAAIDWVVQHRRDNGMNIRVLGLSYGTDSSQDYRVDPLSFAVEQAWKAGVVVVAAAGNAGFSQSGSLTDPAFDPYVITVGAADTNGTLDTSDDTVASFSSNGGVGALLRPVDVVAPGVHIISLRDPGSYIDDLYSSTGAVSDTLFRGSGTSESTAVVAGCVALLLQQRPSLSPDQVKKLLWITATRLRGASGLLQGAGEINLQDALRQRAPNMRQFWPASSGAGSLEGSRGSIHVTINNVTLSGERDIFGAPFDAPSMAAAEAARRSWSGGTWNGNDWAGNGWLNGSWQVAPWTADWSGNSWSGNSWSGNSWSGNSWSGNSWSGNSWSGNSWSGNSWSSAFWG
jgi:serine protease AprX